MKSSLHSDLKLEDSINSIGSRISDKARKGSMNYELSTLFKTVPNSTGLSLETLLKKNLSDRSEVGGSQSVSADDMLSEISEKLSYTGDHGSHPSLSYIHSDGFRSDLANLKEVLLSIAKDSDFIVSFWLAEGHPFYPVFWDFGFMIESHGHSFIYLGSSSD